MKARKTKNGTWQAMATYKDGTGKWRQKSFTAATKREAVKLASDFEASAGGSQDGPLADMTNKYIDVNAAVLSVTTVAGYRKELRCHIEPYKIAAVKLSAITDAKLQEWVSDLSKGLSVKTVKNAYALVSAVLKFYQPGKAYRVRFQQPKPKDVYIPTAADLAAVLDLAAGPMKSAIRLAMYGGLREGEIAALTAAHVDIEAEEVRVVASMARTENGDYVTKPPKTAGSVRTVPIPRAVLETLPKRGRVVPLTPGEISWRFQKLVNRAGVRHFNFHSLRKYSASYKIAAGMSLEDVKDWHGWSNNYTALSVYIRALDDRKKEDKQRLMDIYAAEIGTKKTQEKTQEIIAKS